jgi:hypothetical protein
VVITDKVSDAPTEPVGERMRRLAAENGAKPVIEWVESVIDYNETHFRWLAGQTTTEDLERAHKRKIAAHTALSPEQRQLPFLKDGGDGPMTGNPEAFRQKVMLEVLRLIENKEIVVGDGASETHVVVRTFEARDYDPTTYPWMASGLPKSPDEYGGAEFDIVTMPRWVARGEAPIDYRYTITITET